MINAKKQKEIISTGKFNFFVALIVGVMVLKLQVYFGGQRSATIAAGFMAFAFLFYFDKNNFLSSFYVSVAGLFYILIASFFWGSSSWMGDLLAAGVNFAHCSALFFFGKCLSNSGIGHQKYIRPMCIVVILIGAFDFYMRIYNPWYALELSGSSVGVDDNRIYGFRDGNFHTYKMGSIMFFDSNYSGILYMLCLYVVIFSSEINTKKENLFYLVILTALAISTLSRAAIFLTAVVIFVRYVAFGSGGKYILPALSILLIGAIFFYSELFNIVSDDESGSSKFSIINDVLNFKGDFSRFLFGFGFTSGWYIYSFEPGFFAHIHLAILMGQLGFFSVVIYMAFFAKLIFQGDYKIIILSLIVFIIGFSLLDPWDGFVYFVFGLISTNRKIYVK